MFGGTAHSTASPQRSFVDWLIRDRFLIAPSRKAPIENGPRWRSYNLPDRCFLNIKNVSHLWNAVLPALGRHYQFCLVKPTPKSMRFDTRNNTHSSSSRKLIQWENFFFECWNCTFYKPGMFMGLRLDRSKNTPFTAVPIIVIQSSKFCHISPAKIHHLFP